MGSSAVPLTGILAYLTVTGTEHEARDGFGAAAFALCPVHVGELYFLKCFGFDAPAPYPSPATHQGVLRALEQVLCEVFRAQADGQGVVGEFDGFPELQQGDVMIVKTLLRFVMWMDMPLRYEVVTLFSLRL